MKPKKELGQNFLQNVKDVENLVNASEPKPSDVYLEIGPGRGAVTKILAPRVEKVIAVELDGQLTDWIKKDPDIIKYSVDIVHGDVLRFLSSYELRVNAPFNKIIGSIPYQITSPLLHSLAKLSFAPGLESITLLIQKEVAEKILAPVPNSSYLSNFVQTYFEVKFIGNVSRGKFYPIPKVDGSIIVLQPKPVGLNSTRRVKPEMWSSFLHQGFKFPRKMLRKVFDEKMLESLGIRADQRPQEIELEQWLELFKIYDQRGTNKNLFSK